MPPAKHESADNQWVGARPASWRARLLDLIPEALTASFEAGSALRIQLFKQRLSEWRHSHRDARDLVKARMLARNIRYVPLAEFRAEFGRAADWAARELGGPHHLFLPHTWLKVGGEARDVLRAVAPKSGAWLAALGERAVSGRSVLAGHVVQGPDMSMRVFSAGRGGLGIPSNVLCFDDGSYSGAQALDAFLHIALHLFRTSAGGLQHECTIWFVIPYCTPHARSLLELMAAGTGTAASSDARRKAFKRLFKMLKAQLVRHFSKEEPVAQEGTGAAFKTFLYRCVRVRFYAGAQEIPSMSEVYKRLGITRPRELSSAYGELQGLLVFEHKAPDSVSFPEELARGDLVRKGTIGDTPEAERVPFVTQTDAKPYGVPAVLRHVHGRGESDDFHLPP
jgi:hypothetical protein